MLDTFLNGDTRWHQYFKTLEANLERYLMVLLYFYIFFIIGSSVITRYTFNFSPVWASETAIFMYIYLTWLGASWNVRKRSHIRVDLIQNLLPERGRALTFVINDLAMLAFTYFVFVGFIPVLQSTIQLGAVVQSMYVSQIYFIFAIPLGFALIAIRSVQMLYIDLRSLIYREPVFDGEAIIGGE